MTERSSYPWAVHYFGRCPIANGKVGCQPPAGVTPFLSFGLPSLSGVVTVVAAPGSVSGKHPLFEVCESGPTCHTCGGCGACVPVWGCGVVDRLCCVALHACWGCPPPPQHTHTHTHTHKHTLVVYHTAPYKPNTHTHTRYTQQTGPQSKRQSVLGLIRYVSKRTGRRAVHDTHQMMR